MFWKWATMVFAAIAAAANLRLMFLGRNHDAYPFERAYLIWHLALATGAIFYTFAFGVLIFTDVDRAEWSSTLTPMSAVTFFLVWTVPAVLYRLAHAERGFHLFGRHKNVDVS